MTPPPPRSAIVILEWLLIPVGLLVFALALPHSVEGDDTSRFRTLGLLLEGHLTTSKYSLTGPMFAVPLVFVGRVFADPEAGVLLYNELLFACALLTIFFLLRHYWSSEALRRFLLLLVCGSMFAHHLLHFGAETFTATLAGVGLLAAAVGGLSWAWCLVILAAANAPAALPGFALAAARQTWRLRKLRFLLAPLIAVVFILFENWIRRGSPFHTGYELEKGRQTIMPYSGELGMSYPLFFGMLSILMSFGKGILFFAPGLCLLPAVMSEHRLELPERLRAALSLWLAFLLGLMLVYARWWSWYGGLTTGPRFFLFASFPASLLLAQALATPPSHWLRTFSLLLMLALSCWVTAATTLFENGGQGVCTANQFALEHLCWYTPEFSVLWNPFVGPWLGLSKGRWIVVAYETIAFLMLAVPLVVTLKEQLSRVWQSESPCTGWRL